MWTRMLVLALGLGLGVSAEASSGTINGLSQLSGSVFEAIENLPQGLPRPRKGEEGTDDTCPPCFNCMLPAFSCKQFATCNEFTGRCDCPAGFGGDDCSEPQCGGLNKGANRPIRANGTVCECEDGWSGINCNMCNNDRACDAFMPAGELGTCYKGGLLVNKSNQMCKVTNRKILDILNGRIPEVTFNCDRNASQCNFQFWVDQRESFFCSLDQCDFAIEAGARTNVTKYSCESISCSCIPDRMLCGEAGSIDITEFLTEAIQGPGYFQCDALTHACTFSEAAMNDLIKSVFGDASITLDCDSSECLHYTELPGYSPPVKEVDPHMVYITSALALTILLLGGLSVRYFIRLSQDSRLGYVALPSESDGSKMMAYHKPASLQFRAIGYSDGGKTILDAVDGSVAAGQVLAIMGGSGAGKTTLLDLLAKKTKRGASTGQVHVNGRTYSDAEYKRVVGFVDQDDYLMPTLTVYETVVTSALLRLPRAMSDDTKRLRALETLAELGILDIKDQLVGSETDRGISGGEKRRVAIACELVTSPSILFLDEPTSGLDAYNAHNVVECLASLAKTYNRTVVFTIHQPRSNIVALFDQLIVLARGKTVYSGPQSGKETYFSSIGLDCPPGYNFADYLIDLTVAAKEHGDQDENETGTSTRSNRTMSVDELNQSFVHSAQYQSLVQEIDGAKAQAVSESEAASDEGQFALGLKGYEKAGLWRQFVILSGRTFKNLYRNPMLLLTHYVIAVLLGGFCGFLYFNITNDISGFQNRLGLFFFLLALFGFSTLTTLQLFAQERIIFVRERANGYYHLSAYYCAKVLFDIIPLRVFPPIVLGMIVYPLAGLTTEDYAFAKFLLILVLFNLTAASTCLLIGIVIADAGVANLVGCLVMLFSLLFAGLFLNPDSMPPGTAWFQRLSIFHYAYEALAVNEVKYLTLTERKFGLSIEVPGATILSTFGFDSAALWPDVAGLAVFFAVFLVAGYGAMHWLLVERR